MENFYIQSRYNLKTYTATGELLLSNVISNKYLKFNNDTAHLVEKVLKNPYNNYIRYYNKIFNVLTSNGFLVDNKKNEESYVEYIGNSIVYSNDMLYLTIIPTNGCNFMCKYCYQDENIMLMEKDIEEKIIKYLKRNVHRYNGIYISWFGGEPLLAKKTVIHIMSTAKEICNANRVPLYGQMTTNGYLLDSETFKTLLEYHLLSYTISIDGIKSTHNYQRPHKTNKDSYTVILNNLKDIKKINRKMFKIGIRVNISPVIIEHMEDFLGVFETNFSNDKRFGLIWEWVKDWGGNRIKTNNDLLIEKFEDTHIEDFLEIMNKKKIWLDNGHSSTKLGNDICIASRKNGFTINYDGKVYKCAMALNNIEIEDLNNVGFLRDNGTLYINEYKNSLWVGLGNIDIDKCRSCIHYPECMGLLCPLSTNILKEPKCLDLLKKKLKSSMISMNSQNIFIEVNF